jgi:hypothetical protein
MTPSELHQLLALRDASMRIPFCPHVPLPTQRAFLKLMGREALYGGAAGGGKSDALLMAALQFIDVPGYNALLLRRTFKDLSQPEALMHRARAWFSPYTKGQPLDRGVRWSDKEKRWIFPTRDGGEATIGFGYLAHELDVENYQGAAYQYVAYDETTHFTETQYTYLFSRQRKPERSPVANPGVMTLADVPLRMRAATNPGGVGHKWVMRRFGLNESGKQADSWLEKRRDGDRTITKQQRPFVPAKKGDNTHLNQATYSEGLAELDETRRAQLEEGLWIQDAAKRIYHYDAKWNVAELPTLASDPRGQQWKRVLIIDLGATTADRTTSFTLLAYHPHIENSIFVEYSHKTAGEDPWTIAKACTDAAELYGSDLTIVMDEGALGKGYGNGIRSRHSVPLIPAEKTNKRAFMRLLRGDIERGYVHLVGDLCVDLSDEFDTLIYDKHGMDAEPGLANHCTDGLLYGWRWTYAHRSQAPAPTPTPGSPEWMQAEADRLFDEEYRRAQRDREDDPWS